MVAQFVFFFLLRAIFRENSAEMDVKTVDVMVKKKTSKTNVEMLKCCSRLNFLDELAHATPPLPTRELACSPGRVEESLLFSPDLTVDCPLVSRVGGYM